MLASHITKQTRFVHDFTINSKAIEKRVGGGGGGEGKKERKTTKEDEKEKKKERERERARRKEGSRRKGVKKE